MAKKKTTKKKQIKDTKPLDSEPIIEAEILSSEDKLKTIEKFNKLKATETMTIPDEAVVNIPLSGQFYKAIDGLFYYLMDDMTAPHIITTMNLIRTNFEGKKPEEISNKQRAIWTIMTLLSEIHWQADAQDKLVKTEKNMHSVVQQMLHGVENAPEQVAELAKIHQEQRRKNEPANVDDLTKKVKNLKEKKKFNLKGDKPTED
jgi:hypothetical protein